MANLSASDLRGLLAHQMQLLALPVLEFLQRRHLGGDGGGGWGQAPSLASVYGVKGPDQAPGVPPPPPQTCTLQARPPPFCLPAC